MGTSINSLHPGSPHTNTSYQHEIRCTHDYTPQTVKLYDANKTPPLHGRRHLETDDVTRRPPPSGHCTQNGGHTPSAAPQTNDCKTENHNHTTITPRYNTLYVHKGDNATATTSQPAAATSLAAETRISPTDTHTNAHALPTPIDFDSIKAACEIDVINDSTTRDPQAFSQHRIQNWPDFAFPGTDQHIADVYNKVKQTGIPNAMGARIRLPNKLKLDAWALHLSDSDDHKQLLDFLTYGFPLGYMGPVSSTAEVPNHSSALEYPRQVDEFVNKEIELGGLQGPYPSQPFKQWCHVSPLMTRPKKTDDDRRIITDMSYPRDRSVNAFILKNTVLGQQRTHSLPTVEAVAKEILAQGQDCHLATLDIKRAYKNLTSDVLDWPLLCFKWRKSYFCDISVPFGSKASASHMQRVADAIVGILTARGIYAKMYLDDIIIVSPNQQKANIDFQEARDLLMELGLPEATDKAQPPATAVTWLGIVLDTQSMTLSIPDEKLKKVKNKINIISQRRSVSKKKYQSLLGALLHVAKCIAPARLFVSRLLEALRDTKGRYVKLNGEVKKDLRWFREFSEDWNGVGLIASKHYTQTIFVDACLTGIGGTNGRSAYAAQVAQLDDPATNICHLEAANVVVAMHTFVGTQDDGGHVHIYCDNEAAVQVLSSGKGRDRTLLDCARGAWMIQAKFNISVTYDHIPGKHNDFADDLSRAHINNSHAHRARSHINDNNITVIKPCEFFLHQLDPCIHSRSGIRIAAATCSLKTTGGKGSGYIQQQKVDSHNVPGLCIQDGLHTSNAIIPTVHGIHRVHNADSKVPKDSDEQGITRQGPHDQYWGATLPILPPKGHGPPGGYKKGQSLCASPKEPHPNGSSKEDYTSVQRQPCGKDGEGSGPPPLPRGPKTIRSPTTLSSVIPRYLPPHKRRRQVIQGVWDGPDKGSEEPSVPRPTQRRDTIPSGGTTVLPDHVTHAGHTGHPNCPQNRPHVHVSGYKDARPYNIYEQNMAQNTYKTSNSPSPIQPPLTQEGSSYGSA